jgi:hypothetical protein
LNHFKKAIKAGVGIQPSVETISPLVVEPINLMGLTSWNSQNFAKSCGRAVQMGYKAWSKKSAACVKRRGILFVIMFPKGVDGVSCRCR